MHLSSNLKKELESKYRKISELYTESLTKEFETNSKIRKEYDWCEDYVSKKLIDLVCADYSSGRRFGVRRYLVNLFEYGVQSTNSFYQYFWNGQYYQIDLWSHFLERIVDKQSFKKLIIETMCYFEIPGTRDIIYFRYFRGDRLFGFLVRNAADTELDRLDLVWFEDYYEIDIFTHMDQSNIQYFHVKAELDFSLQYQNMGLLDFSIIEEKDYKEHPEWFI